MEFWSDPWIDDEEFGDFQTAPYPAFPLPSRPVFDHLNQPM
jgi:hypothetical protein